MTAFLGRMVGLYRRWPGLALFLLFLATSLVTRGFLVGVDILDVDEAMHIAGSWELLRGGHIYVGFVDNKPPLLYAYYAVAQLLFGRGMLAIHLLTVLVTVPLSALGVSAFYAHDRRGVMAGMTFLVFGAAYLAHDMHAANCEILMLLPATWAVAAVRDEERSRSAGWLLWAGGLLGIAMLFKQQALAWSPALVLSALLASRGARRSLLWLLPAFVAGLAIPLLATWAFFAARGESQAFLYWTVFYNLGYAQQPMEGSEALVRIAKYFLPFVAATVGLWIMVVRARSLLSRHQRVLVWSVLCCTFPIVFVGFRMYPHYFVPLYTPLALGAAPLVAGLCAFPLGRWAKLVLGYGLASLVCFSVANGILYLGGHKFPWEEYNTEYRQVADIAGGRLFRRRVDVHLGPRTDVRLFRPASPGESIRAPLFDHLWLRSGQLGHPLRAGEGHRSHPARALGSTDGRPRAQSGHLHSRCRPRVQKLESLSHRELPAHGRLSRRSLPASNHGRRGSDLQAARLRGEGASAIP